MKSVYVALTLMALAVPAHAEKLVCYGQFNGQTDDEGVQSRTSDMTLVQLARSHHTFNGDLCKFGWTDKDPVKGINKLYAVCRLGNGCMVSIKRSGTRVEILDAANAEDGPYEWPGR